MASAPGIIERFVMATEGAPCCERFRRWAGAALVSTMLSRNCWTDILGGKPIYANLFIGLVGDPGSGKTDAIEAVKGILKAFPNDIAMSANDITPQVLLRRLGQTFVDPATMAEGFVIPIPRSYGIMVGEVGTLLKDPDPPFMQTLADLWSGQLTDYTKDTKSQGTDRLFGPYVTMLAGAQPGWVARVLDRASMEMGLPGRIYWVQSKEILVPRPFQGRKMDTRLKELLPVVEPLLKTKGEFAFTQEAQDVLLQWYDAGFPGRDGRCVAWSGPTKHFASRRQEHSAKLALVAAASNHPSRSVVTAEDAQQGLEMLWDGEQDIAAVMGLVSSNHFRQQELEVLEFVDHLYHSAEPPIMVSEALVRKKLAENIPTNQVESVLKELVLSGKLVVVENRLPPHRKFGPGAP